MSKWLKGLFLFLLCGIASATTCYLSGGSMLMIGGFVVCVQPAIPPACPQTSGTITINAVVNRSSGISPLAIWVDSTGTTDSAVAAPYVPFQRVYTSVNFGDSGTSGTGTWAYGSNGTSNGGTGNSRNTATGGIVAHDYIVPDGQGDTSYTPVITATNGTDTVSCSLTLTVYDPTGANGITAGNTTCYFNSTVGSGCPAGATQTTSSVFTQTNGTLSNKRLLYKCGDTFTGDNNTAAGSKVRIGAYGGCQQTKSNRPIWNDTSANYHLYIARTVSDLAISDIDMESSNTSAGGIGDPGGSFISNSQVTISNVKSAGNAAAFSTFQGGQTAIFDSEVTSGITTIAVHINSGENNCANGNLTFQCGQGAGAVYLNIKYIAVVGTHMKGVGTGGSGIETLRIEAWQQLYVADNDLGDSSNIGAPLKIHSGNTNNSQATWIGQPGIYGEFSDNWFFGNGGGAGCHEIAPQNSGDDERIQYIVIERDLCAVNPVGQGVRFGMLSAKNLTMRNTVYLMAGNGSLYAQSGPQFMTRGSGNFPAWQSTANEAYNITCNITTSPVQGGQECISNDGAGGFTPVTTSVFKNNMVYSGASAGHAAVSDTGSNTVSNNTTTSTNNPSFTNASGTFKLLTDWKPTANYTGGTTVPSLYDALGVAWAGTWDLGAVHH